MPFANAAAAEMFGFARDVLARDMTPFFARVHPDDARDFAARIDASARTLSPFHALIRYAHPANGLRWIEGWSVPNTEPDGSVLWHGFSMDVTERKRAEEDLRAAEERFRALVTASSDVVYRMNPDWTEMWHLVGRDFVAGTDAPTTSWLQKYVPREEQARVMAAIQDAVRDRRTFELEHRVVRADGTVGWTFSRAIPLLDARGAITEWYGMASDVTARKRAEEALRESESFCRQTLESIPGMVFTTRPDGYCDYQSQQWVDYTGVPVSEHLGDGWSKLLHPDDRALAFARWQAAVQGTARYDLEYRVRRKDGEYEWFRVIGRPIRDEAGAIVRWFGVAMNIEAMKRTEDALRDADRRKDEFLAMLSHELRNPLAPIRNSTYVLRHASASSEQARRAQTVIERQTAHLTRLVDDLLDVTRIARGKIELRRERLDLRDVVSRAADDFRVMLRDRAVRFEVVIPDEKLWADADPTRLTQVIGNLLHNAAKFTRRGDEVTLTLHADGAEAEIRVRDTGVGIEPALLPRVFEPFVQGDRTLARTEGGLGLGLALVKGIAELHGGTVRAESAGNSGGAEFVVRLPLVDAAAAGHQAASERAQPRNGGHRVLVVDDNADAAESLAELVRMLGHGVEIAYDGPTAIEKARLDPPDVVLCDIGLPGMSGYDVARRLRASGSRMQLIAVSGYAQPEDVKQAIDAGFDGHLAKPCDAEEIERLLS
jgi:PAS domain S-box-containing protein